jgi:hypothetical protein
MLTVVPSTGIDPVAAADAVGAVHGIVGETITSTVERIASSSFRTA